MIRRRCLDAKTAAIAATPATTSTGSIPAACRCLDCDTKPIQARLFTHASLVETTLRRQPPADHRRG
jgi:hypothetical protein